MNAGQENDRTGPDASASGPKCCGGVGFAVPFDICARRTPRAYSPNVAFAWLCCGPVSGAMGMLGKLTGGSCGSGTTVPFMIEGTASDPKFVPDVGGLAAGALKSQLGCATGGTTTGSQRKSANPLGGITGLFEKK